MINRIINKLKGGKTEDKTPIDEIIKVIQKIRKDSTTLAICPNNTGPNWLGIKRGTLSLFPFSTLILDQYYSHSVYSDDELSTISEAIIKAQFQTIILRGFPQYFEKLISNFKSDKNLNVWAFYAGPISEFNEDSKKGGFEKLIHLAQSKQITGLGFNKKGLAESVSDIYNINAKRYILKAPSTVPSTPTPIEGVNIGVFGGNTFNKNIYTQVFAGLSVPNAKVHVLDKEKFKYLNSDRIIGKGGNLNHDEFLLELGKMTINSYLAFSESWGNIILESASMGVPCITTANNGIYDWDDNLSNLLVVKNYDDVMAIKKQMQTIIDQKSELKDQLLNYTSVVNQAADEILRKNFFD